MVPMMQPLEPRRLLSGGTLTLNGAVSGASTYSGTTTINAGTLLVNSSTASNTVSGGTLTLGSATAVTLGSFTNGATLGAQSLILNAATLLINSGGTLTFAATSGPFADATIQADQQALREATQKLVSDNRAGRKTLRADEQAIRDELQKFGDANGQDTIKNALQPLQDKLRADIKARNKELRGVAEELRVAKRDAMKIILADLKAWREARVNNEDQATIDAAKKKLDDDKAQAAEDLKPIRDKIEAIKDKWRPIVAADYDAIPAKIKELDPAVGPLMDKRDDDADALKDKLDADQDVVADAAKKLRDDLKAWYDAHQGTNNG